MRRLGIENKIRELLARFVAEAKLASAMERYDSHRVSEDLLVPLLRVVFGYKHLRNLNQEEQNFPGIDLADDKARIAIQVSADRGSDKIKSTLRQFVDHALYRKYDQLKIYILTERQKSYSGAGYDEIIGGRFSFDKDQDIWDFKTIGRQLKRLNDSQLIQVLQILESYFSDSPGIFGVSEEIHDEEVVWLNLLEVSFPRTLYLADIDVDRETIIRKSRNYKIRLTQRSNHHRLVRAALEQQGLEVGRDWISYEGKILTFHDLDNHTLPFRQVLDQGTITVIESEEFYDVDENQERVFKWLLQRCLEEKLYHQGVRWHYRERLYFFTAEDGVEVRKEQWPGNPGQGREVFKRVPNKNQPEKTAYYKHLAFRTAFQRIENSWYLQIMPDWFFSSDGYRRSFYHEGNVSWVKRREKNPQVFNQLRFIVHFLKSAKQLRLFTSGATDVYPYLSFGELIDFSAPALADDTEWLQSEDEKEQQQLREAQKKLAFTEK